MAHDVQITAATSVDTDLVHAIHRLVKQLSASGIPPTREELEEIVKSASTTLLLARDGAQDRPIIGSLTLVVFRIPTGLRA